MDRIENPFDFPSSFWFGWSLCVAALFALFASAVAYVGYLAYLARGADGWMVAWIGFTDCCMWINTAQMIHLAIDSRRRQKRISASHRLG